MSSSEDEIKAVETEFQEIRDELKEMLFDIRTYLMEAQTPIPNDLEKKDCVKNSIRKGGKPPCPKIKGLKL